MKHALCLRTIFSLLALMMISIPLFAQEFFVSPEGNDSNTGTSYQPFKSPGKALQAAFTYLSVNSAGDCTIWFNEGVYPVDKPLHFPNNATLGSNHLYLKNMPGTNPVISGGLVIENWEQLPGNVWKAKVPEIITGKMKPGELFFGSTRCTRARYPNEGYLRIDKAGSDRRTHFFFREGDFPIPEKPQETELVLLHDWSISRIGIREIDREDLRLTAVDSIGARSPSFFNIDNWEAHPRYYLENAPEFLDTDYEWYYHAEDETIMLKLPGSVNIESEKAVIPLSEGLVLIEGTENNPAGNIHFEGISFFHSAWEIPARGYGGVQACHYDGRTGDTGWSVVPAAIMAVWAENCTFTNCRFAHMGGSGLWFATGCKNCTVSRSAFDDISGNGIMIGEGQDRKVNGDQWWKSAPGQVALGNKIEDCVITNCGARFSGAVGIWGGLTAETVIRNNVLHDLPYTGISMGWMWSPVPTPSRGNIIEGNHIHHIMKVLSDGGGIYMLGLQPDSRIVGNHIHDVSINAGKAESNGMFLDEGTTSVVVEGNLIYNIAMSPLRFHRATVNLVKDNFLFCGENMPPVRYNTTKEEDIIMQGNKIFSSSEAGYDDALQKIKAEWGK